MTPVAQHIYRRINGARPDTYCRAPQSRFENALHEGAHGLTGCLLGVRCTIRIIEDPGPFDTNGLRRIGQCTYGSTTAKQEIQIAAAGALAQMLAGYTPDDREWGVDWAAIERRLNETPEPDRRAFWLSCVLDTEKLLQRHFAQLRGLALYLMDRCQLDGKEINEFLELTKGSKHERPILTRSAHCAATTGAVAPLHGTDAAGTRLRARAGYGATSGTYGTNRRFAGLWNA
jgi:hypothetical protein